MNTWQAEELRLWNLMQDPVRGRKITFHSVSKSDRKKIKKISELIEKQKEAAWLRGWQVYEELIRH